MKDLEGWIELSREEYLRGVRELLQRSLENYMGFVGLLHDWKGAPDDFRPRYFTDGEQYAWRWVNRKTGEVYEDVDGDE